MLVRSGVVAKWLKKGDWKAKTCRFARPRKHLESGWRVIRPDKNGGPFTDRVSAGVLARCSGCEVDDGGIFSFDPRFDCAAVVLLVVSAGDVRT
jgi:hypothetical protein